MPPKSTIRPETSSHRAARAGDLLLGGLLAMVLLIACIAWEAMSGAAVPKMEGALSGEAEVSSRVRAGD